MKPDLNHFLIVCLLSILTVLSADAQGLSTVYIYHTSDTHSRIESIDINSSDTAAAGKAGAVRRAAYFETQRRALQPGESMLLFDCGDFSQGSPYYNLFKGEVEMSLMNAMGYSAATVGNHEFDFGLDNMARIFRQATFPIVCSNYDFTATPVEGLVKPYTTFTEGDLKIGGFGVGAQLKGMVQDKYCEGVGSTDPVQRASDRGKIMRDDEAGGSMSYL